MKKVFFILCLFVLKGSEIYAQIYFMPPQFVGGYGEYRKYVSKYTQVPDKGRFGSNVLVNAVIAIDKTGKVRQVTTLGPKQEYNREVKRVLKLMPDWIPATLGGLPRDTIVWSTIRFLFSNNRKVDPKTLGDTLQVIMDTIVLSGDKPKKTTESPDQKQEQIQFAQLNYNEGVKLVQENNFEEALKKFTMAIEKDGNQIDYLYNRGVVYYKLGLKQNSCKDWIEASRLNDSESTKLYEQHCRALNTTRKSALKKNGLLGKVKEVKIQQFDASESNGNIIAEKPINDIHINRYNEDGDLFEALDLNTSGRLLYKCLNKYDNTGNQTQSDVYEGKDDIMYTIICKYDEMGNKSEDIAYVPNGENSHHTNTYYIRDYNGNLIEKNVPGFKEKFVYKYDKMNNLIEYDLYENNVLKESCIYVYDENKNCIEFSEFDKNGISVHKYNYKYDSHGSCIEKFVYNGKANKFECKHTYKYEYDKEGNITQKISKEYFKYTITKIDIQYY